VVGRDLGTQRGEVERGGHPQRPGQGPATLRQGEAGNVAMQVSPPSGQSAGGIGRGGAVLRDHPQQLRRGRALAAADASALRPRRVGHPQVAGSGDGTDMSVGSMSMGSMFFGAGADMPVGSTSGRMSMRQPVKRAASRAFWPSRPMASESW
jgi:hypothetical protein